MSEEIKSSSSSPGTGEPSAVRSTAPMWIIVLTLVLLFLGGVYFDHHSGWLSARVYAPYRTTDQLDAYQPKSGAAAAFAHGKGVYESVCGICHGADGLGKPGVAPPLAGSSWVTAKGDYRLAHIPLAGINGPVEVAGKDWNMAMAAMGAALPDDDLAAVLTYIRGSWGNKAPAVTSEDIAKARASVGKSPAPYTPSQLMAMPE
jgi:mono/diheme cytochrome c family protein